MQILILKVLSRQQRQERQQRQHSQRKRHRHYRCKELVMQILTLQVWLRHQHQQC